MSTKEKCGVSMQDSRPNIQARTYDELFQFGGSLKLVRAEHRRVMRFFTGARNALDVGCGRAVFLHMLREIGVKPVGVDLSPAAVQYCHDQGFAEVYHAPALEFLRQHPQAFDAMLCSHIVEHMPYDDAMAVLSAAYAALTPGGRLVVVTPNARDLRVIGEMFWLDPTHVRPYPLMLLHRMFLATGFDVIHTAQPLGRPNKRGLWQWPLQVLLLGSWFGHPNTIIVGKKPGTSGTSNPAEAGTRET
jgi:O-antigen chain-terminating methyltransferase